MHLNIEGPVIQRPFNILGDNKSLLPQLINCQHTPIGNLTQDCAIPKASRQSAVQTPPLTPLYVRPHQKRSREDYNLDYDCVSKKRRIEDWLVKT